MSSSKNLTHGASSGGHAKFPPAYRSWLAMRARCLSEGNTRYENYGGAGVTICAAWLTSYEAFLADMGEPPPGYTLDRIDPKGNYEPGNVRWASASQQATNKRNSPQVEVNGVMMHYVDACNLLGLNAASVSTLACRERATHAEIVRQFVAGERGRKRRG